jgi:hypothetical protein
VKFFPHEVCDLEYMVELLHFAETDDWCVKYILLLWLSIVVLVPFDIDTIDSKKGDEEILIKRIINLCKVGLENSGKIREGSGILISKLVTRPDVVRLGDL